MNDVNNDIENNSLTNFYNNCLEGNSIQNNLSKNIQFDENEQNLDPNNNVTCYNDLKQEVYFNEIHNSSSDCVNHNSDNRINNNNNNSTLKKHFKVELEINSNEANIKNSLISMIKNFTESNDLKLKTKKFESDIIGLEKVKYHYYKVYKSYIELNDEIANLENLEIGLESVKSETNANDTIDTVKDSLKKSTMSSNNVNTSKIFKKEIIRNKTPLKTQLKEKIDIKSSKEKLKIDDIKKVERSKTPMRLNDNIGVPNNVSKRIETRRKSKSAREETKEEKIISSTTNKSKSPITFHRNNQNPMSKSGIFTGAVPSNLKDTKKIDTDNGFNKQTISNLRKSRSKIKDSTDDTSNTTSKYVKKHVNYQIDKDKGKDKEIDKNIQNKNSKSINNKDRIVKKDVSSNKDRITKEQKDIVKEVKKNNTTNLKPLEKSKQDKNDFKKENSVISTTNKSVNKDTLVSSNSIISVKETNTKLEEPEKVEKIEKIEKIEKMEKLKIISKVREFKDNNLETLFLVVNRG